MSKRSIFFSPWKLWILQENPKPAPKKSAYHVYPCPTKIKAQSSLHIREKKQQHPTNSANQRKSSPRIKEEQQEKAKFRENFIGEPEKRITSIRQKGTIELQSSKYGTI